MTCTAVSLLVPSSMEKEAQKKEFQISFDGPPSYLTLLGSIEQQPTALKLDQVNFHIKAGKEFVLQDNWARLVRDRGAINLAVRFMARTVAFSNLLIFSTATCAAGVCRLPVQLQSASQGHVEWSYANLILFTLQAHLCIPKHPMVTTRSG